MPARSVCVIGARGVLGRAVAEQFQAAGWTVLPAGRTAAGRAGLRELDLDRPETIARATRDAELIVSTVAHADMTAERLVIEQGGTLVNCSHAPGRAVAAIGAGADPPRGSVLLNAGLVPGVANLVAAELLERWPEADCLEVGFTVLSRGSAGRGGGAFAHEVLSSRARHRVLRLRMPAPFGELACLQVGENRDSEYAGVAGSRRVETYLGFGDPPLRLALRVVNALGLMRLLPRAAFALQRGDPAGGSQEPTAIWVGVRRGNERLGAATIECDGDYRTTAAAARIFGERMVEGERRGCFNPEDLFTLADLRSALQAVGLRVATVGLA